MSLGRALQENLVTLLCFDDEAAGFIRGAVDLQYFEGIYHTIASAAYRYYDEYRKVPQEHISDLLEEELEDEERGEVLKRILLAIYELRERINRKYVFNRLEKWVRQQQLRSAILDAADALQGGDDDAPDRAEAILQQALRARLHVFDPGTRLLDVKRSLAFLDNDQADSFPTGISQLDALNYGPRRGELHLFIGLPKAGKTWWFVNLGKRTILQRYRVLHVTLEMSEALMAQRYFQSLFGVAKRNEAVRVPRFQRTQDGDLEDISFDEVTPSFGFEDPDARDKLLARLQKFGRRIDRLVIKQFPTGSLSVRKLAAYLDMLEDTEGFVPDLLIVDYADLMDVDPSNYRHSLGRIYVELRGLAVERNIAVATASQANRRGASKKRITEEEVAEDWSKIATADCVLSFSRTETERALGLGRIFVAAGRNDVDKFEVVVAQNYAMGQFVVDSVISQRSVYDTLMDTLAEV